MILRAIAVAAAVSTGLAGQTAPSFDVASIKPSHPPVGREGGRRERIEAVPGSLIMGNVRFVSAVRWAWHVFEYQVSGPGWIGEERFDINAKAGSPVSESELREMLQTLLADRFQLAIHRETKVMQAYVVTVAKGGHKMQEATCEGRMNFRQGNMMSGTLECADLDELASLLTQPLQAPVINMTGLKGRFDIKVDAAPYMTPEVMNAKSPAELIGVGITAAQELLGLKIESKKVPVEMIVIDRAVRTPIEN